MMAALVTGGAKLEGSGFISLQNINYNNTRGRRRRNEESNCRPHPPPSPRLLSLVVCQAEAAKGSGTTARGRRLVKIREEKRKREYDRVHKYPAWAKVLEDACKDDGELRAVLGDSIGNPELMRKRVEERIRQKGRDFTKSKTGSVLAFKVTFRE